jgi:inner membrane protein YidH
MIPHFTDHAANERTYLAWIRTAIAIMAFGFVIERFDLFLAYLGERHGMPWQHSHLAEVVGLVLIALSGVMMVAATARYLHHRRAINARGETGYGGALGDALLGILLISLGLFLVAYVAHQLVAH